MLVRKSDFCGKFIWPVGSFKRWEQLFCVFCSSLITYEASLVRWTECKREYRLTTFIATDETSAVKRNRVAAMCTHILWPLNHYKSFKPNGPTSNSTQKANLWWALYSLNSATQVLVVFKLLKMLSMQGLRQVDRWADSRTDPHLRIWRHYHVITHHVNLNLQKCIKMFWRDECIKRIEWRT